MSKVVKNGWHVSKKLMCEFNVLEGKIIAATDLNHTKTKRAYGKDGYRTDSVIYSNRYSYKWC